MMRVQRRRLGWILRGGSGLAGGGARGRHVGLEARRRRRGASGRSLAGASGGGPKVAEAGSSEDGLRSGASGLRLVTEGEPRVTWPFGLSSGGSRKKITGGPCGLGCPSMLS